MMDTRNLLSVINLMPQNQEVQDHLETIFSIAGKNGCKVKSYQPRDKDSLRRAWISNCSLVYMIGHAEPESGLELLNGMVGWFQWQQIFHENPRSAILNFCYSQPGLYWQSHTSVPHILYGHQGPIERKDALYWGKEKLVSILEVGIS